MSSHSAWSVANFLSAEEGGSLVAVVGSERDSEDADWLVEELAAAIEGPQETLSEATSDALLKHCSDAPAVTLIVPDRLSESEWRRLDRARSRLERARVVFVLDLQSEATAAHAAPNLWSVLSGRVFRVIPELPLNVEDRDARLVALREAHGLTDEELRQGVRDGSLGRTADIAEWLVLLGEDGLLDEVSNDRKA